MTDNNFEWRLRDLMNAAGIHQNAELRRRLADDGINLSTSQVHRLVTDTPDRLNLSVLASLCRILNLTPTDLIHVNDKRQPQTLPKAASSGANVVDLASEIRPKRARITRD